MEPSLLEHLDGGVLTLTLNRPARRNALDEPTITHLHRRLADAGQDRAVRTIVLAGAGGAFSAGADLKATVESPPEGDLIERAYHPTVRAIRRAPQPVIAAVDGVAAGFGASLALAADIRLASPRASFSLIFARIGLGLDGGASWFLPRLVGMRAYELAMTGDLISADEAHRLGLVNHVYPEAAFAEEVQVFARRLAAAAPLAVAAVKRTIDAGLGAGLDAVLEDERIAQRRLFATADFQEGVAAFLTKRAAEFKGE